MWRPWEVTRIWLKEEPKGEESFMADEDGKVTFSPICQVEQPPLHPYPWYLTLCLFEQEHGVTVIGEALYLNHGAQVSEVSVHEAEQLGLSLSQY